MISDQEFIKQLEQKLLLNETQYQAVMHEAGPLLLLASPGSGKTTTIIARIGYLIQVKQTLPKHILAVSFSKASAHDLLTRFQSLFPELTAPHFSTIHSLAYNIMRTHLKRLNREFVIIEGDSQAYEADKSLKDAPPTKLKLLSTIYEQINGERAKEEQLEELVGFISLIKNKALTEKQCDAVACNVPQALKIYERYEYIKQFDYEYLLIDYDDMLTIAMRALKSDKNILLLFQSQYRYILTDESQDTSLIQHRIIASLVAKHQELFVVADDDQAIYSWRGADVQYLLQFKQHYPQAKLLFLQQNYRSTKSIVQAANLFIKQNKSRYVKEMFTKNDEGQDIHIVKFVNGYKEVSFIADKIQQGQDQLGQYAILYRNHISNILLMNELDKRSIPFYMKDADDRFFKHWILQDILNLFRLSYSDKHFHIFEAVSMKLQLYINFDTLTRLNREHQGEPIFLYLEQHLKLEPYQRNQLAQLQATIPILKDLSPKLAIIQIREKIGYNKVIKQLSERQGFKYDYLMSILDSLELIADGLDTLVEFVEKLQHLETIQQQARRHKGKHAVTLSTLHSAKGLEFNTVFMMDLIEGVLPSRQDTEKVETMEEAVRLFYVGMTRARQTLYLMSVEQWFGQKVMESRFVRQLSKHSSAPFINTVKAKTTLSASETKCFKDYVSNPAQLTVNTLVEHTQFGRGKISGHDGSKINIDFEQSGVKVFLIAALIDKGLLRIVS